MNANFKLYIPVFLILFLTGCNLLISSFEHISAGGRASSNEIEITGAYSYINNDPPNLLFAMHKTEEQPWTYSYVMLVKYPKLDLTHFSLDSKLTVDSDTAFEATQLVIWDFLVNIIFELSENNTTVHLNNQLYSTNTTPLFLVDMTDLKLEIEMVDISQDSEIFSYIDSINRNQKNVGLDWLKNLSNDMIETLRKEIPVVTEFIN